jgi:hypothetical protein
MCLTGLPGVAMSVTWCCYVFDCLWTVVPNMRRRMHVMCHMRRRMHVCPLSWCCYVFDALERRVGLSLTSLLQCMCQKRPICVKRDIYALDFLITMYVLDFLWTVVPNMRRSHMRRRMHVCP